MVEKWKHLDWQLDNTSVDVLRKNAREDHEIAVSEKKEQGSLN